MPKTAINSQNLQPYLVAQEDVAILINAGMSAEDLQHSQAVAKKALEIACRIAVDVDLELVGRGALFHDLGKAKTHAIEHGRIGAEMGQALMGNTAQ